MSVMSVIDFTDLIYEPVSKQQLDDLNRVSKRCKVFQTCDCPDMDKCNKTGCTRNIDDYYYD